MRSIKPLKRRINTRKSKQRFVIVTEGTKTEPEYFTALGTSLKQALIEVEIDRRGGSPLTLAQRAVEIKRSLKRDRKGLAKKASFLKEDEVWIACDRDEHPKISEAFSLCKANKIGIEFSDPCFELWLILHLEDFDKPDDRHQVQDHLCSICESYGSHAGKTANFGELLTGRTQAEHRARVQNARREKESPPKNRPYTTVYMLTEKLGASVN